LTYVSTHLLECNTSILLEEVDELFLLFIRYLKNVIPIVAVGLLCKKLQEVT